MANEFHTLAAVNKADIQNHSSKLRVSNTVTEMKTCKAGGLVTFGIDNNSIQLLLKEQYGVGDKRFRTFMVMVDNEAFVEAEKELAEVKLTLEEEIEELAAKYIYIHSNYQSLGSDEWGFEYTIDWLPKTAWEEKKRAIHMKHVSSMVGGGGTYGGAWDTPIEALQHGIAFAKQELLPLTV